MYSVLLTLSNTTNYIINQDYSLLSSTSCFQYIDECNEKKNYQQECLQESKECFSYNNYGFDYCFKMLTDCVRETEEGHDDHEHEGEEEEENCGCSCQMEKCFGLKDKVACSAMFDVCFAGEDDHEGEAEDEAEERGSECVERARECLYQSDHQADCLHLLSSCLAGEEPEQQDCAREVTECIGTNKYNTVACSDLIKACTVSSEVASDTRDCYSHIELCYRTSPSYNHQVCSGLTPSCYQHWASSSSSSCYTTARSCLLNSFINNSICHHNLETCLARQDYKPAQYGGNVCKENIKLCLASSQYSAASCYDDLQLFLAGEECSSTNHHQYQ